MKAWGAGLGNQVSNAAFTQSAVPGTSEVASAARPIPTTARVISLAGYIGWTGRKP